MFLYLILIVLIVNYRLTELTGPYTKLWSSITERQLKEHLGAIKTGIFTVSLSSQTIQSRLLP